MAQLLQVSVPAPEIQNTHDGVDFKRATVVEDRRLVAATFSHWPLWAIAALRSGLDDLKAMSAGQRKAIAVKASKARARSWKRFAVKKEAA